MTHFRSVSSACTVAATTSTRPRRRQRPGAGKQDGLPLMHEQSTEITRAWQVVDWLDNLRLPGSMFAGTKTKLVDWLDGRLFPLD
jgi:hypothetical protein